MCFIGKPLWFQIHTMYICMSLQSASQLAREKNRCSIRLGPVPKNAVCGLLFLLSPSPLSICSLMLPRRVSLALEGSVCQQLHAHNTQHSSPISRIWVCVCVFFVAASAFRVFFFVSFYYYIFRARSSARQSQWPPMTLLWLSLCLWLSFLVLLPHLQLVLGTGKRAMPRECWRRVLEGRGSVGKGSQHDVLFLLFAVLVVGSLAFLFRGFLFWAAFAFVWVRAWVWVSFYVLATSRRCCCWLFFYRHELNVFGLSFVRSSSCATPPHPFFSLSRCFLGSLLFLCLLFPANVSNDLFALFFELIFIVFCFRCSSSWRSLPPMPPFLAPLPFLLCNSISWSYKLRPVHPLIVWQLCCHS